ncbi:MAG: arylesterase [Magnetococcales bacterium]|nr:arylesterase [Magnetococcales bacterium]
MFLALVLAAGCNSSTKLSPLPEDAVILAFGDSLTYGTGTHSREESYPAVLSTLIGRKVINAGVPGEETSEGLQRLVSELDAHRPALMILCHGGNDILRKRDRKTTVENLQAIIRMARERNVEVVLVGVPAFGLFLSTATFYGEVAEAFNLPFEGEILSNIIANSTLKSDMIHPNAEGYRRFAKAIAELLQREGAVQ